MSDAEIDDEEIALLYAWREGDRAAGDRLVRAYYPRIVGFFRLRVPSHADDLAQRTFLACTEGKHRVATSSFRAFLFGVAHKTMLKQLSEAQRDREIASGNTAPVQQSLITPSGVISLRQEHWLLLRALDGLDDETQTILALHYLQSLKAREIGDVLGMPTSTITTRLARARQALVDRIETLRASARVRDVVLGDLDAWARSLDPILNAEASDPDGSAP